MQSQIAFAASFSISKTFLGFLHLSVCAPFCTMRFSHRCPACFLQQPSKLTAENSADRCSILSSSLLLDILIASGLPWALVFKLGCVIYGLYLYLFCALDKKRRKLYHRSNLLRSPRIKIPECSQYIPDLCHLHIDQLLINLLIHNLG